MSRRSRRSHSGAAAIAVGAFVGLTVAMDWVRTPLNRNITSTPAGDRLPGTLIHCATGAAVIAADLGRRRMLILPGALWYTAVLVSAGINWWLPYLTGVTIGEIDSDDVDAYAANVRVLPPIGDHAVVPDVQHMLIHASVLGACVLNWAAFVRRAR